MKCSSCEITLKKPCYWHGEELCKFCYARKWELREKRWNQKYEKKQGEVKQNGKDIE